VLPEWPAATGVIELQELRGLGGMVLGDGIHQGGELIGIGSRANPSCEATAS
jgi:hypothetical protein